MEMEVMKSIHNIDFDFNSSRVSEQIAPSTPKRFGEYYCSAPTSPTHFSQFYRHDTSVTGGGRNEDDFSFSARDESETASLTAEELFDGGIIKPFQRHQKKNFISQIPLAFSSEDKKKAYPSAKFAGKKTPERERGRETSTNSYSSSRRATRSVSLSPLRVSENPWEEEGTQVQQQHSTKNSSCTSIIRSSSKGQKKWRLLKDIFLFRSASEGRAADKDPLKKHTAAVFQRYHDSPGSGSGSRRGPVSAHELHYTINKAVSEDLKKKTFLPYKQGILGRLAFNPAVHALANGFGLSRK